MSSQEEKIVQRLLRMGLVHPSRLGDGATQNMNRLTAKMECDRREARIMSLKHGIQELSRHLHDVPYRRRSLQHMETLINQMRDEIYYRESDQWYIERVQKQLEDLAELSEWIEHFRRFQA